jgi:hypothetical protein
MLRSAGQQGSSSLAGRLLAENGSPESDQGRAATRIALRPHDPGTGEEIDKREIVKGYEYGRGQFVTLTPEELKALEVESSKVIDLETFVPRGDLDPVYFDSSYYLYPDGPIAVETLRVGSGDWFSPGIRFARDSPLEGSGFELLVPGCKIGLTSESSKGGTAADRAGSDPNLFRAIEIGLELRSCENSGSQVTPRWREPDSNCRSRRKRTVPRQVAARPGEAGN